MLGAARWSAIERDLWKLTLELDVGLVCLRLNRRPSYLQVDQILVRMEDTSRLSSDERTKHLERPSGFQELVAQRVAPRAGIEMTEQSASLNVIEGADGEDRDVPPKSLTPRR